LFTFYKELEEEAPGCLVRLKASGPDIGIQALLIYIPNVEK
jgi:hypothetical protein